MTSLPDGERDPSEIQRYIHWNDPLTRLNNSVSNSDAEWKGFTQSYIPHGNSHCLQELGVGGPTDWCVSPTPAVQISTTRKLIIRLKTVILIVFQGTDPALTLLYVLCNPELSAMSDMLVNRQRLIFPNLV